MTGTLFTSKETRIVVSNSETGGPQTVTVEITCVRNDGQYVNPNTDVSKLQQEGHLPVQNQPYYTGTIPDGITFEQFARCRSLQVTTGPRGVLIATATYSTLYTLDPETNDSVLPTRVSYSSRSRTTTLYRTGWTTSWPTDSSDVSAEIGGDALAGGIMGQSYSVPQTAIRVRLTYDASFTPMDAMYQRHFPLVGKRNSDAFGGFPAYSLICEGVTMDKASGGFEFYEATIDLLYDPWFHFSQVADTSESGLPVQNSQWEAGDVKWRRVTLPSTAFNSNIFTDGAGGTDATIQNRTLDGWWWYEPTP